MKILVFSDSHGKSNNILKAIENHGGVCDLVVFLGDGLRDIEYVKMKYPTLTFACVEGNSDIFSTSKAPSEMLLDLDGIKVLLSHGHLHRVKGGIYGISAYAHQRGADAVLYGHTHRPSEDVIEIEGKNIQLFNPGSIGYDGIYGVVNTSNGVLVTGHGKIY